MIFFFFLDRKLTHKKGCVRTETRQTAKKNMHRPTHAWVKVPLHNKKNPCPSSPASKASTSSKPFYYYHHRTLCLEYPPKLLTANFTPTNPNCPTSNDAAVTGPKSLIMVIPGNPGMSQFYRKFIQELCRTIPSLAVVVPSLAGFSLPTEELHHEGKHRDGAAEDEGSEEDETEQDRVFLLKDQCEFLYSFVDSFVVPIVERFNIPFERTWCLGHSIGGYFCLHVLDHFRQKALQRQADNEVSLISSDNNSSSGNAGSKKTEAPNSSLKRNGDLEGVFRRTVLLAPTIAYMSESNNAKALSGLVHHGKHVLPTLISGILTKILPKKFIDILIDMALAKELDAADVKVAQQIVHHPKIMRQILKLASDELNQVNPIDEPLLSRIQEHVIFYFVQSDDWVPRRVHDELRMKFANKTAGFFVGEDPTVKHAWCSRSYAQVAHFVAHAFGSETGVQVTMSSAEAAKAGFVLRSDAKKGTQQEQEQEQEHRRQNSGSRRQRGE